MACDPSTRRSGSTSHAADRAAADAAGGRRARLEIAFRADRLARLALLAAASIILGASIGPAAASAHARSVSYSSWEIDAAGAAVTLRLPLLELSRLGPEALPPDLLGGPKSRRHAPGAIADAASAAADAFAHALVLVAGEALCPPSLPVERRPDADGWVRYVWRVDCATGSGPLAIRSRVLLDVAPSHLHFARARFAADPGALRERVLTEADPVFTLRAARPPDAGDAPGAASATSAIGSDFGDYLALGVRHIASGWDHLAFLFGLILLADRLGSIARLVTGFTLAHSLTLALSVLDLVHPRAAAVEAVIAFSVALVAIEKGWLVAGRPRAIPAVVLTGLGLLALASAPSEGAQGGALPLVSVLGLAVFTACYFAAAARAEGDALRIVLTFAFGLVHGFGFAGILVELALPTERLVPALVGFNLGVELGQIAIVLLLWPMLGLAQRAAPPGARRWARDLAIAGLCGLGCFWLVSRAWAS